LSSLLHTGMVFCSNNAEVIIPCCDCPLFQIGTETEAARDLSEKSLSVLQDLKKRTEEVVRENQRLQLKGGVAGSGSLGKVDVSEW